jgi:hypothetical protein
VAPDVLLLKVVVKGAAQAVMGLAKKEEDGLPLTVIVLVVES